MVYAWELEYLEKWSTREIKNQIWMAVSCHQPIQGSVSLDALRAELVRRGESPNSQYETIVLPLITDYNCRHSAYPMTKPSYTEEQLKALDPPPFAYEGRQYAAYEAQQQMRKMERSMRRQKDRCIVVDAVGIRTRSSPRDGKRKNQGD